MCSSDLFQIRQRLVSLAVDKLALTAQLISSPYQTLAFIEQKHDSVLGFIQNEMDEVSESVDKLEDTVAHYGKSVEATRNEYVRINATFTKSKIN